MGEVLDPPAEAGAAGSSTTTGEGGTGGEIFATTSSTGGAGGGPLCDGECYLWKESLFDDLAMFWIGPSGDPPVCPETAPSPGTTLRSDLVTTPHICPECSCSPAGCALPEHMYVSAGTCPGDGAASIAWDSPAWDGACSAEGAIAPGLMCGGEFCTQSFTVSAPAVAPCEALSQGDAPDPPDPVWGLVAHECILGPVGSDGCSNSEACLAPPPEGFSLCLYRHGADLTADNCPSSYPRYLLMYAGHDDSRACDPGSCSDPQGGECSALVSLFTGGACGGIVGSITVTSAVDEGCLDLPPGVGLGSKAGTLTVSTSGSCTSSGGPVGGITPTLPMTLCCQEAPLPPAE